MSHPQFEVVEAPAGRLRIVTEDQCWLEFRPVWGAPLTHPNMYLALLDEKEREILMIDDPADLDETTRKILLSELDRRVLTAQLTKINSVATEFGVTYWEVETTRGSKEFVTQSLQENAQWMGDTQLLIIDIDGNRFEVRDYTKLDNHSQDLLMKVV